MSQMHIACTRIDEFARVVEWRHAGDGLKGNCVTSAIGKGVVMDEPGVGEIVMPKQYFGMDRLEILKRVFLKVPWKPFGC